MSKTLLGKISISALAAIFALTTVVFAQTDENAAKKVNFRYSQNPKTRAKTESGDNQKNTVENTAENTAGSAAETGEANTSIAKKTLEIAKKASSANLPPTEIYRVGSGDVLFISLQNAPKSSTYFTVLNDGTIDYPLAGEMVSVAGLTTDEIEELLGGKIKLFENPQVSVKVREYASRKYSVLGLVERAGEKKMQREAIPLFVARAEAIVQPRAAQAVIRRAGGQSETIDLKDKNSDNVLIFAGDIVEFTAEAAEASAAASGFYFIGGEIVSGGQKEFHKGLTLTQAILASGGLKKQNVRKIVVRRKSAEGLLVPTEYNLKAIKDGKIPDPVLMAGDTIEVGM